MHYSQNAIFPSLKQKLSREISFTFSENSFIIPSMNTNKNKSSYGLTRRQEQELSRTFGKHVSASKAAVTLVLALAACASPMLLGIRLWNNIPPIVETGLIGPGGADDSLPRPVLVFGIPGLMCVLTFICHAQLWLHQKAKKIPPVPVRTLGRWWIPILSVFLSSYWIRHASGELITGDSMIPCCFALALLLLGVHFYDCPRDSVIAFHLKTYEADLPTWNAVHRFAGVCWMLAGLQLLLFFFSLGYLPWYSAVLAAVLLLLHFPAAKIFFSK